MLNDHSLSLYVHIPFCASKCDYCDFTSFTVSEDAQDLFSAYFEALRRELLFWKNNYLNSNDQLISLYIGGGTPSVVPFHHYEPFLEELYRIFEPPKEFTCEVNPASLNEDFLRFLNQYGCTRISMGLQSPVDDTMRLIARHQSVSQFLRAYSNVRKYFSNVNVDLICGLPESLHQWAVKSGDLVERLSPEHCSIYILELEKDTPLGKKYRNGQIELPSFDYTYDIFEQFIWRLKKAGYQQYEISNFALPGYESVHNHAYWHSCRYIGIGVSAGGFINQIRYVNTPVLNEYQSAVFEDEAHYDYHTLNSDEDNMKEFLFMGLRLKKGIKIEGLQEKWVQTKQNRICEILSSSRFMTLSNGYLKLNDYFFIHNRPAFEYLLEVLSSGH
ncbi:MAG TPA: radical SAM family heme chaperone HemW [Thermotogota bacterium]|nr:radical SAM family heme chaperone HemW [Thermotogota bacterium]HRW33995.1 radical SAM family heme chaperone HemW [Thermotogota bacterium]